MISELAFWDNLKSTNSTPVAQRISIVASKEVYAISFPTSFWFACRSACKARSNLKIPARLESIIYLSAACTACSVQQLWPRLLSWHCVPWLSSGTWWDYPFPWSMVQALLRAGLHSKPLWLWNLFPTASGCDIGVCPVFRAPSLSMGHIFNSLPKGVSVQVCLYLCVFVN